jgi:ABC-type transport system substrate-binding protein
MKKNIFFSLLLIVLITLTWWSWTRLNLSTKGPTLIRLALDQNIDSLDPAKAFSDDSLLIASQVLESLYQYHYLKRPYEIEPLLAESKPIIEDQGKLYRIKIKCGSEYHPHPSFKEINRKLKAEDFVNQFKRLSLNSLNSPGRTLFAGLIIGFDEYAKKIDHDWRRIPSQQLEGFQAIDDCSLRIKLTKPEPNLIYYLALNFIVPIPWEIIEYNENKLDQTLIGTGPYQYIGFNTEYYELRKFKGYRKDFYPSSGDRYANVENLLESSKEQIPFIDTVRFDVSLQENERWEKFMNHELDILSVPKTFITKLYDKNGDLSPELKSNDIILKHFPILASRWLAFNMKDPILGENAFLRRAIAFGINYSEYMRVISQNTNLRANSILVPGISGYQPAKDFRFKYDPHLAKEYLKMGGFTDQSKMPEIIYSTRGNQGINLLEANFIKEQLEAIGLKVKIQVLTFSEFLKKGRAGELMFFTDNWLFDYPDAENILQLLISPNSPGINKSAYKNAKIDQLYIRLKSTTNQDLKDKIVKEMEDILFEELPWIPMMYESSFVIQYPEIKNFRKSSIIRNYVKYLKIEN